jgi:hypothetical protein
VIEAGPDAGVEEIDPIKLGVGARCPPSGILPFCDDFDGPPSVPDPFVPPWDVVIATTGNSLQRVPSTATPPNGLKVMLSDAVGATKAHLTKTLFKVPGRVFIGFDAKATVGLSASVPIAGLLTSTRGLALVLMSGGTALSIYDTSAGGGDLLVLPLASGRVEANQFVHVAWLIDGPARTTTVWIDRARVDTVTLPVRGPASASTDATLYMGPASMVTGGGKVDIDIDNVRVGY